MRRIAIHFPAIGLILVAATCFSGCSKGNKPKIPDIAISMASFQIQRWSLEASTITRMANEKGMAVITLNANSQIPALQGGV